MATKLKTAPRPDFRISEPDAETSNSEIPKLRALVAALEKRIAALEAVTKADNISIGRRLTSDDQTLLENLLPLIYSLTKNGFTTQELFALAAEFDSDPRARSLMLALASTSEQQLGFVFRRCRDVPVNGLKITRTGRERGGVLWQVDPA